MDPASPRPIVVLRIGLALTLLIQAAFLAPYLDDFYGPRAFLQEGLTIDGPSSFLNIMQWSPNGIRALAVLYVVSLIGLLIGKHARVFAVSAWLSHMIFTDSQASSYGLDQFAHQTLFLLMFAPLNDGAPSSWARLSLRVLQIQLCIGYFWSGLEKALGTQWWTGVAVWRTLMLPTFLDYRLEWLTSAPWIPLVLGWGTLLLEMGYPFFIWPRWTRPLWLVGIVAMHAGIGMFLGLWLFALIMILLNVSLFAVSAEPARVGVRPIVRGILPSLRLSRSSAT